MSAKKKNAHKPLIATNEHETTFSMFMKVLMVGVGGAVIYFFGIIVYLGGWGHSPSKPYVAEFSDRIQYEYSGKKIPMYEDPSLAKEESPKEAH